jgi:hypothetical protein
VIEDRQHCSPGSLVECGLWFSRWTKVHTVLSWPCSLVEQGALRPSKRFSHERLSVGVPEADLSLLKSTLESLKAALDLVLAFRRGNRYEPEELHVPIADVTYL